MWNMALTFLASEPDLIHEGLNRLNWPGLVIITITTTLVDLLITVVHAVVAAIHVVVTGDVAILVFALSTISTAKHVGDCCNKRRAHQHPTGSEVSSGRCKLVESLVDSENLRESFVTTRAAPRSFDCDNMFRLCN